MPVLPVKRDYTLLDLQIFLGLSRPVIRGLIARRLVTPRRGPDQIYRFSLEDVALLRSAHAMHQAHIPLGRIHRILRRLQEACPLDPHRGSCRLRVVDGDVIAEDRRLRWRVETGQLLLDFESHASDVAATPQGEEPLPMNVTAPRVSVWTEDQLQRSGEAWFVRGVFLERRGDRQGAQAAYEQAIGHDKSLVSAYSNLIVLLCESGALEQAWALCLSALTHCGERAGLLYNGALALELLGRCDEAMAMYQRCLTVEPRHHDAHCNMGLLHESRGDLAAALAHFEACMKLQPQFPHAYQFAAMVCRRQGDKGRAAGFLRAQQRILASLAQM